MGFKWKNVKLQNEFGLKSVIIQTHYVPIQLTKTFWFDVFDYVMF